jgi:hypothetical protein
MKNLSQLQALFLLGQHELTTTVSVADMTLYVGTSQESARVVVTGLNTEGQPDYADFECSRVQALAIVSLATWGDEAPSSALLYASIGTLLDGLPLWLRPIP